MNTEETVGAAAIAKLFERQRKLIEDHPLYSDLQAANSRAKMLEVLHLAVRESVANQNVEQARVLMTLRKGLE